MTDAVSKTSQSVHLGVYSRNKGNPCEVQVTITDDEGNVLYSLQTDPIKEDELKIDTSKNDCTPNALVTMVATASNRVVGSELIEQLSRNHGNGMNPNRPDLDRNGQKTVKTWYDKVVTDVQGEIRDRATGQTIKVFSATSDVRYVPTNNQIVR